MFKIFEAFEKFPTPELALLTGTPGAIMKFFEIGISKGFILLRDYPVIGLAGFNNFLRSADPL